MKRVILLTLQVLGWVAFVPFVFLSISGLIGGMAGFLNEAGFRPRWYQIVGLSAVVLAYGLPGLAIVIAARIALRREEQREMEGPGFTPIMKQED